MASFQEEMKDIVPPTRGFGNGARIKKGRANALPFP
jgi:hypothetical protein